jgi:hypothetical protein
VEGFGVPLAYCLLNTATSIAPLKRRNALEAFLAAVSDRYGLDPDIVLTDKDFAEIGAVRAVWPRAKHQLCYWHIRKAVRERMAMSKLSTALYHPFEANAEFGFISLDFLPRCGPDRKDPDSEKRNARAPAHHVSGPTQPPTRLPTITLPATQPAAVPTAAAAAPPGPPSPQAVRIGHILLLPTKAQLGESGEDAHVLEADIEKRAIFCPEDVRAGVVARMERHFCAHPLLPGTCAPTAADIRFWAVKSMYDYCAEHDLPKLWAYMWEGWYRPARWVLWARSAGPLVPRLKTTMLCESQYVTHTF